MSFTKLRIYQIVKEKPNRLKMIVIENNNLCRGNRLPEPVASLPVMSLSNGRTAHDEVLIISHYGYCLFWAGRTQGLPLRILIRF